MGSTAARPQPLDRRPQVPRRQGIGIPKAPRRSQAIEPQLELVRGRTPPSSAQSAGNQPTFPAPRVARAQSRPGRRRCPLPRPIQLRILPLVERLGAAQQPAPIGQVCRDYGLPLGQEMSVLADDRPPGRGAEAQTPAWNAAAATRDSELTSSRPPSKDVVRPLVPEQGPARPATFP